MKLLLRSDLAQHQSVPKEYEMDFPMQADGEPQNVVAKNTFIFSEQDLPGFRAKNKLRADAAAAGIPAHLLRQKEKTEKPTPHAHHGRRGRQEYYRKAIPSTPPGPCLSGVSPVLTHISQRKRPSLVG